jgi:hypothetical protein
MHHHGNSQASSCVIFSGHKGIETEFSLKILIPLSIIVTLPLPQPIHNQHNIYAEKFVLCVVCFRHPVVYEESLNTILVQDVIDYNRVLDIIHSSLR